TLYSISVTFLHFFHFFLPLSSLSSLLFFFNDTATTEIYTLSLHDALPISVVGFHSRARWRPVFRSFAPVPRGCRCVRSEHWAPSDRKSTRLNSSHDQISYAVFCLKKKK